MRVSQEEKQKTYLRIVKNGARLMRERGLGATSLSDVMNEAGLTNGGFYRHFKTKDALLAAGLQSAFDQMISALDARFEKTDPPAAVAAYHTDYVSKQHVDNPGSGCPVAALGGDVARAAATLKTAFGAGVNRMITQLARGTQGSLKEKRESATRELAMLAGAVMIARASDPETARAVLLACQ